MKHLPNWFEKGQVMHFISSLRRTYQIKLTCTSYCSWTKSSSFSLILTSRRPNTEGESSHQPFLPSMLMCSGRVASSTQTPTWRNCTCGWLSISQLIRSSSGCLRRNWYACRRNTRIRRGLLTRVRLQRDDPVMPLIMESSEEGQKVSKNQGKKFPAVFRRIRG